MQPLPEIDEILSPFAEIHETELTRMATACGVPRGTLWKILRGYTRRPSYESIRRISRYAADSQP